MIIAIDGHSSCGKSSFAKRIAQELGFIYIDSGAMYRAVTLFCIEENLIGQGSFNITGLLARLDEIVIEFGKKEESGLPYLVLNGRDVEEKIRSMEVSSYVSEVAKTREVREKMVILQRAMSRNHSVVMDGRDIGTVVFPDAGIKIFLTASLEVRTRRRYLELINKGVDTTTEAVLENLAERDRIDQGREISPLRQAEDAVVLDNSDMTIDDQMAWFYKLLEEKEIENSH